MSQYRQLPLAAYLVERKHALVARRITAGRIDLHTNKAPIRDRFFKQLQTFLATAGIDIRESHKSVGALEQFPVFQMKLFDRQRKILVDHSEIDHQQNREVDSRRLH